MKIMKKIGIILLSLCLCVPCFSLVADAADGRISFTDPETAVGDTVEVKCVLRSTSGNLGDIEVKLDYDSESLKFESGDGVESDGDGALTYSGTGSSSEASFTMKFQALKEGEAKVSVSSATIASDSGATLTLDQGNSTVKIAEGDPSKIKDDGGDEASSSSAGDVQVEVNGVAYTLTDNFADADIPNGYSRTKVSLDGQERQMVENETSGACLAYLKDADSVGDFFLYNEEDATFAPYEEITVSDTTSIIVLSDTSKVKLPSTYQEAKLTLNNKEFPVWQDSENEGYYVLYAMSSNGETGYYQYDSAENTYQRFRPATEEGEKKNDSSSLMGKIQDFLEKHLQLLVLVGGLGLILIVIILIVLAAKLHNRNAELDELYDEYGIDEEEEEEVKPAVKKKESKFGFRKKADEDDFDDYGEEDHDEDDFDDYEDEDDYEESDFDEDDFDEDDYEEAGYEEASFEPDVFAGYEERRELTIDDLDDLLGEPSAKKRGHIEDDDTFKVDFIDLD